MRAGSPHAAGLQERDRELELLDDALRAACRGGGRAIVVEGEAGIGKTSLLVAAQAEAAERGMRALAARGGEQERDFALGIVRQLFEDELLSAGEDRRRELLQGPAAQAAPLFGLATGPVEADPAAIQHGLYRLAVNLAREAPLLVVVDDVHWADLASLRWLLYLARRIEGVAACALLGLRTGEAGPAQELVPRVLAEPGAVKVELGPLSEAACRRLVGELLDDPEPELCAVCYRQTNGNPFFLRELCQALGHERLPSRADRLESARRLGPDRLRDSVLVRLLRLPAAARELVRAVAVLEIDAEVRHAAALAGLDPIEAAAAADQLSAARILDQGVPLRFAHPILRAAVYRDLSGAQRAALHRRAADLLAADGQIERAGAHILATPPHGDSGAVDLLRAAAARALSHGAAESAADLLERAMREPPAPALRPAVQLDLGHAERLANRPEAEAHLREAREQAGNPAQRARAAGELGAALMARGGRPQEMLALLREAAAELRPTDPDRALELEVDAASVAVPAGRWREREAQWLAGLAEGADPRTPAGRRLLGVLAYDALATPGVAAADVAALVDRAASHGSVYEDPSAWRYQSPALPLMVLTEIALDRLEAAHRHTTEGTDTARTIGSVAGELGAVALLGKVELARGDLAAAERRLRRACAIAEEAGHWDYVDLPVSQLVLVLVEQGRDQEARELLERHGLAEPELPHGHLTGQLLAGARIQLWLARGDTARAAHDAGALERMSRRRRSPALLDGGGHIALALLAAGQADAARCHATGLLQDARRWGVPSAVGHALRACGLVEGGAAGLARLQEAVDVLRDGPRRLELAHALLDLGSALRRAGERRQASEPLRRALDLATSTGARRIGERARDELRLCGLRPRRAALSGPDSLTVAERRVAELAAAGHGNADIARLLVVSRRTVETHLSAIYRKLDISGRDDLPAALSEAALSGPAG